MPNRIKELRGKGAIVRQSAAVAEGGPVAQAGGGIGLKGLTVMVIDDSKTIRRTAETLLEKEGCSVVCSKEE